jgi:hypothetical protein
MNVTEKEWHAAYWQCRRTLEFIRSEYEDPSQIPNGEWLAPEARPIWEDMCNLMTFLSDRYIEQSVARERAREE